MLVEIVPYKNVKEIWTDWLTDRKYKSLSGEKELNNVDPILLTLWLTSMIYHQQHGIPNLSTSVYHGPEINYLFIYYSRDLFWTNSSKRRVKTQYVYSLYSDRKV